MKEFYLKNLKEKILADRKLCQMLAKSLKQVMNKDKAYKKKSKTIVTCGMVSNIAARRLLNVSLLTRKIEVKTLLQAVSIIKNPKIDSNILSGKGTHTISSEPYFYDASYKHRTERLSIIATAKKMNSDKNLIEVVKMIQDGVQCVDSRSLIAADDIGQFSEEVNQQFSNGSWSCTFHCKPLTISEKESIISFKEDFNKPIDEVRKLVVETCDSGCPNLHYSKVTDPSGKVQSMERGGHPLVCHLDASCTSRLKILRAASTHYKSLRCFLRAVYKTSGARVQLSALDRALQHGDVHELMKLSDVDIDDLLNNHLSGSYVDLLTVASDLALKRDEISLQVEHSEAIACYNKEVSDYPIHPCISCHELYRCKNVTQITLNDELGTQVWARLKAHVAHAAQDNDDSHVLYICSYCKSRIKENKLPPRCILNSLHSVQVPEELSRLDPLSKQMISRAKSYQVIVRLGTYSGNVPHYKALKACKGSMFFLPLPFNDTSALLDSIESGSSSKTALPDSELFILVNGVPTKDKVVWHLLINVDHVRQAIMVLKATNWLYKDIDDESIDVVAKSVIEVVSDTSSHLLEKLTEEEIDAFQSFTIRNLDNKLSTKSDIEQYKMLNIKENPLSNKQKHLDVLCFPTLFPDGRFGEYHSREISVTHSEYIKSRLYNKDSRYRKEPQYVFYLLWQKEMGEIAAGIYNVINCKRSAPMSVSSLLNKVEVCDEVLESNLMTMLQNVRGTKQYWFIKQSQLRCMIREWGSPTLFLTFSCAEYESTDIITYLRKVNHVPKGESYDAARLCVEDPISVSRIFSLKFHSLFKQILIKGSVLGVIQHYYFKKEYQARGAPHYHVLLWIQDAPLIGRDDPDKILKWNQERIMCRLPNQKTHPDIYALVTRYQTHRCSQYCQRRRKHGKQFVTTCKFNFPRDIKETAQLNCVNSSLKVRQRIYSLVHSEAEIRINDYNPLLLMLWRANIDIQFIAESSLALAHYECVVRTEKQETEKKPRKTT